MAQQARKKAVRPARKATAGSKPGTNTPGAKKRETSSAKKLTKLQQSEREREQLADALAQANARIAELEAAHEQVINRLDWVIDSLSSLKDEDR